MTTPTDKDTADLQSQLEQLQAQHDENTEDTEDTTKSQTDDNHDTTSTPDDSSDTDNQQDEQHALITKLHNELAEQQEIAKKAQHDYINIKMEFNAYMERTEKSAKEQKTQSLLDVVKKFLPLVESLRVSIDNIPEDDRDNPLAQGVIMTHRNFLKQLENMNITPIESLGLEPDSLFHEPISTMPAPDEESKGKIVQVYEQGYVYRKGDIVKTLTTSKVVVGA